MIVSEKTPSNRLSEATIQHYKLHARDWEGSGIKQADYCKNHGLNYHTFSYVRNKFLKTKQKQPKHSRKRTFIAVHPKQPTPNK